MNMQMPPQPPFLTERQYDISNTSLHNTSTLSNKIGLSNCNNTFDKKSIIKIIGIFKLNDEGQSYGLAADDGRPTTKEVSIFKCMDYGYIQTL